MTGKPKGGTDNGNLTRAVICNYCRHCGAKIWISPVNLREERDVFRETRRQPKPHDRERRFDCDCVQHSYPYFVMEDPRAAP